MSEKILLTFTVFLVTIRLATAGEPPPHSSPSPAGVLLLRNGQAIEGHIERNGDYYTVTAPGQEIQIHAGSVEFLCRDMREGYQRKKAAIQPNDVEEHLQLLLWCERHELFDCAREQLDAAEAIDRTHPILPVLRRRLKIEAQQKSEPVRQAEKIDPPPSDEQLDHMIRGMPPGTVEVFVQVVQPILLNHYPGARGFALPDKKHLQLMRPPLGETPSRRITQRNLYAVLQCIDWTNPGESAMLKASTAPLSGSGPSAFPGRYSTQYQKLAQWVYLVAQKPMPAEEGGGGDVENASFSDLAGGELSPAPIRPETRTSSSPIANIRRRDKKDKKDSEPDFAAEAAADRHGKSKPSSKDPDTPRVPRRIPAQEAAARAMDSDDPYDPAEFNNQSNQPTAMPTPAARVIHGDGQR